MGFLVKRCVNMSDTTKQIKVIIIHNSVQITDTGKQIVFYFRLTRKDGSIDKFECFLDKTDKVKIEMLQNLLLMKVKSFIHNDMKIEHHKNNIFLISIGKQQITVTLNEDKRKEILRLIKNESVKIWRVKRKISVG